MVENNLHTEHNKESGRGPGVPFAFLFAGLVLIDESVKHGAKNVFKNFQFAFSLPLPGWLMYGLYALILASMCFYLIKNYKNFSRFYSVAWVLILAGALSNIGERLTLGYVRDFIYIRLFNLTGVYNLADFYIIAGIIILLACNSKKVRA